MKNWREISSSDEIAMKFSRQPSTGQILEMEVRAMKRGSADFERNYEGKTPLVERGEGKVERVRKYGSRYILTRAQNLKP